MDLSKQIRDLEKVKKEGSNKVFTMYLNTDPSDPDQQGGEWKIHLKNGLNNFEHYLEEDDNNKEELKNFQLVKQKVKKYVLGNEQNFRRGIVVFATADEAVWFACRVQVRVKTEFYWQESPELDQLKALGANYPKAGIILVQQDEVKVIESYLNEVENTMFYELNLETDDWRQKVGPRKGFHSSGLGATNAQKENFKDRFEANKHRWFKSIAPKLDKQAKDGKWEKVYVVGETDASHELEAEMNKPVDKVIHKNMLDHEESKVLDTVLG
jgi:hypothetical protein